MSDAQKPKKAGGRPTKHGRAMTQSERDKAYRDRQRAKLELLKKLLEQGTAPAISDTG